tara:strand:+ start:27119 stop:28030 length:912 start_codon:yes stop_codon:yes gene_type:complete
LKKAYIKKHTISDIIEILGDTHQTDGLHVHLSKNKFEKIPLSYPFRSDNYAFLLVVSGTIKIQLNLITYTLESNEMISIKSQTITHFLEMSNNLEIIGISFTVDFILKNSFKKTDLNALGFFTSNSIPKLKLLKDEMKTSVSLSKLLEKNNSFSSQKVFFKEEIINYTFGLLMYHYASIYRNTYPNLDANLTRQEELILRFLNILNENLKKERTVQFYADVLCITSGHLSKVLKKVSGKTANQLIDEAVIMEAKILLGNPSLSIAEVTHELQFSDQSFFGKYFKKHTGFSPSEFRKTHKTTSL